VAAATSTRRPRMRASGNSTQTGTGVAEAQGVTVLRSADGTVTPDFRHRRALAGWLGRC
jgi:hypothetical protein